MEGAVFWGLAPSLALQQGLAPAPAQVTGLCISPEHPGKPVELVLSLLKCLVCVLIWQAATGGLPTGGSGQPS